MCRRELFELHDHPWFPALLRDLFTDALQAIWRYSDSYKPVLPLLRQALAATGTTEIIDLCSGAGGPWFRLLQDMEADHYPPITIRLTDKYPNHEAFEAALTNSNSRMGFDSRPISATRVPEDLKGFRTMFSTFHHFPPGDACKVLSDAVEHNRGIAIFEMARREPRILLATCFLPFLILVLTPQIRPFHWSRLLWTYVIPVVPFALFFDGWMSCLRAYSQQELSDLVQSLPGEDYRWQLGTRQDGFLPVTYLIGYPKPDLHEQPSP